MEQQLAATANPFGNQVAQKPADAVANTDQARAEQEVQAAMVIAKKFPRDSRDAFDRIMNACTRPKLAEAALYSYPRGGQEITGPSIRLAEAIAQEWGNIQFGVRELSQHNGQSNVEAFAWDLQTNTRRAVTFQVPHVRHTRQGQKKLTDPRDIYELVANQGARRLRACILAVVPGDVVEAAVNQCDVTQQANVDTSPETIKKMLESFSNYGVTQEQIEQRIGKHIDAILPGQVILLKKIYASLRDGMSKPAAWFQGFPEDEAKSVAQAMLEKSEEAPAESAQSKDASFNRLHARVVAATTEDDLDAVMALDLWADLTPAQKKKLHKQIDEWRETLRADQRGEAANAYSE